MLRTTTPCAVREAREDELPAILDVILDANPHLDARISAFRTANVWWTGVRGVVAEYSGKIVSVVLTFRRFIWTPAGPRSVAGLGAVATRSDSRKTGFAGAAIACAESLLANEGYAEAVLFCTIVPFYEGLGWSVVQRPSCAWPQPTKLPSGYEVSRLDVSAAWMAMARVYETTGGAIIRSDSLWRESVHWRRDDPDLAVGAFAGNVLVSYARARRRPDGLELLDVASLPEHHETLGGLVRYQLDLARRQQVAITDISLMRKRIRRDAPDARLHALNLELKTGELPWWPRTWFPIDFF